MASVPIQITLSTNGTYAYTINNNNTESSINLQNMAVTGSFPFTSTGEDNQGIIGVPEGLVFSPKENLLFVLADYSGTCSAPSSIPGLGSQCTSPTLFALNASNINQTIWMLTLTSMPWNISASSGPKQLTISNDGKTLYVIEGIAQYGAIDMKVINISAKSIAKTISFGYGLTIGSSLSISPFGDYIYAVENGQQQDIAVINTSTASIVDTKSTGLLTIPGSSPAQLVNYAPTDVAVADNFTYVVGSGESYGYYLYILNRTNDNLVSLNGLSGCPCEVDLAS